MTRPHLVAIVGGNGFLGRALTTKLLADTDWHIRIVSHSGETFAVPDSAQGRVTFVAGNVLDEASISQALQAVDTAYYFVHMMGQKGGDFYDMELRAAETFRKVIDASSVQRLVYMGGLGNDKDTLSKHLASRHRSGKILSSAHINVIELRASMIIGKGSVGFDIITNLVDKLPIMLLPNTAATKTQPIILADALEYLQQAATVQLQQDEIVEIGGPEVLSYKQIYRLHAKHINKHRLVLRAPFVPAWLEAKFLDYFTPAVHARIGQAMVESLGNEMVVTSQRARQLFPAITPQPIEPTVRRLA